jgi:hypothetical protein
LIVSPRPLVLVGTLTAGDFLLWNWSLGAGHDVLALVSGLTLPPLAAACLLLFALTAGRVASGLMRRAAGTTPRRMAVHARAYLSSTRLKATRVISSSRRAAGEPSLVFDGRNGRAHTIQGRAKLDEGVPEASSVGERSRKPARKLAA